LARHFRPLQWNLLRGIRSTGKEIRSCLLKAVGNLAQHQRLAAPQFKPILAEVEVHEQLRRASTTTSGSL
jgi:hypothetical protein